MRKAGNAGCYGWLKDSKAWIAVTSRDPNALVDQPLGDCEIVVLVRGECQQADAAFPCSDQRLGMQRCWWEGHAWWGQPLLQN
ncbi:hypothetical protein EBU58_02645 [bacterium]|nr:hypothetical protein [bacterium]